MLSSILPLNAFPHFDDLFGCIPPLTGSSQPQLWRIMDLDGDQWIVALFLGWAGKLLADIFNDADGLPQSAAITCRA
jgi:hypothetical protein